MHIKMNFNQDACKRLLVLVSLTTLLTSCGNKPSSTEGEKQDLNLRVSELEAENSSLKAQVEALRQALSSEKMHELADALKSANSGTISSTNSTIVQPQALSSEASAVASTPVIHFTDIQDTPTKDMIEDLSNLHIFDDLGNQFKPNQPITRGEYVTWLYKAYNALEPLSKQLRFAPQLPAQYKDLGANHPAYKYVQALSNAGFSIGYKDGTFRPDKPLTREEMLGIKVGVDVGKDLQPWRSQMETVWKFSDSKDVDDRFTGYINQDYYISGPRGSNIQRAFGKIGTFRPKQATLRYEAAATLWQMGQFGDTQNINAGAALRQKS